MEKWEPIETAPKDTAVLVYNGECVIGHFNTVHRRWIGAGLETQEFTTRQPTHWMPLPWPPVPMGQLAVFTAALKAHLRARGGHEFASLEHYHGEHSIEFDWPALDAAIDAFAAEFQAGKR